MVAVFRITARRDGFRRAGIAHPASPVQHRLGHFTDDQLRALLGEDMLVIEPTGVPVESWLAEAAADRDRLREEEASQTGDPSRTSAPAVGANAGATDAPGGSDTHSQDTPEGRSGTALAAPSTGSGSEGLVQDSEGLQVAAPPREDPPPAADAARSEPPAVDPPKAPKGKRK